MFDFAIEKRLSICLVDENPKTRLELGNLLDSLGIHVPVFCSNLQVAIEEYDNYTIMGPPDFIISEWSREFSDPAFLSFFKNSPLGNIPVIIFSGNNRNNPLPGSEQMKIIKSLKRPIKRHMLKAAINTYLEIITNENDGAK